MNKGWYKLFYPLAMVAVFMILGGCENNDRHFQGYVEGVYTYISSPVSGILDQLFVSRGDRVQKGDQLFILNAEPEASELKAAEKNLVIAEENLANLEKGQRETVLNAIKAQQSQAQSSLALASKTLHRYQSLLKQHLIDKASVDKAQADFNFYHEQLRAASANLSEAKLGARDNLIAAQKAAVEAAQANVRKASWALEQKTQHAPFAAQVFDTLYAVGEVVPAGSPVAVLLAPSDIKIIFFVAERKLSQIKMGQKISFACDGCKSTYQAHITFVSPEAEYTPPVIFSESSRNKLVYRIEAKMDEATAIKMHPGQPVTVNSNQ